MKVSNTTGIARGQTGPSGRNAHLLGFEYYDEHFTSLTATAPATAELVRKKLVKNSSGGALLPGQLVTWVTAKAGKEVTNPAASAGVLIAGSVDPLLPAAGVANGDYFWIVIDGPCKFLLDANATSAEFDALINSGSVAGCVRAGTTSGAIVGRNETAGTSAAGGGAIGTATAIWGRFRGN